MLIPAFNLTSTSLHASLSYHTYFVCPIKYFISKYKLRSTISGLKKIKYALKPHNLQK